MSNMNLTTPIKPEDAQALIENYKTLSKEIEKKIKTIPEKLGGRDIEELECFITLKNNAFIFSRSSIENLLNQDPDATHLAVVLSAHTKDICDKDHPKGSFTLVAMPVKQHEEDYTCIDDPEEYPKCEEVETEVQYTGERGSLVLKRTQLQK